MYAERRKRFSDAMGPGVAVLPAAPTALRNNDVEHPYRQDSDLYYLTGFEEPHSVLVVTNRHPEHRAVLFLQPRDPKRELWDGPLVGEEAAVDEYGLDAAFPIDQLDEKLPEYLANADRLHYAVGRDSDCDERVFRALRQVRRRERQGIRAPSEIVEPSVTLHEMRLRKSGQELQAMAEAARITCEAHRSAMRLAGPGRYEYEVEAELMRVFRAHGSPRPAYPAIVGSGPNATILHYRRNDRRMQDGELLLIDAGCEYDYYASDVTRTFPVSGEFSAEQRAVYEVVLAAQHSAIEAVRPGVTLEDVHRAAVDVLVDGMLELGLLRGSREEVIERGDYRGLYMHRTSHWIGMDVHDVGSYYDGGKPRPLEPGFVLTVEPGLYCGPETEVAERWRGIGVRIEDDVVVTDGGSEVLTSGVPKAVDEVEQLCGDRSSG